MPAAPRSDLSRDQSEEDEPPLTELGFVPPDPVLLENGLQRDGHPDKADAQHDCDRQRVRMAGSRGSKGTARLTPAAAGLQEKGCRSNGRRSSTGRIVGSLGGQTGHPATCMTTFAVAYTALGAPVHFTDIRNETWPARGV